jgi:hypothetical protein
MSNVKKAASVKKNIKTGCGCGTCSCECPQTSCNCADRNCQCGCLESGANHWPAERA